jgi:superfamily II DNA or RNA helicase/tRNA1(Val) A37 N6-methylase TrmN6
MKNLNAISALQSNITAQNIMNLNGLGNNLTFIKRRIEIEITQSGQFGGKGSDEWKKACARELGNFFEWIISSGVALNISFFTQKYGKIKLYEWDKKNCQIGDRITKIQQIAGGSSKGGEIDVLFEDEKNHVHIFSAKFRNMYSGEVNWGDLEIKQMSTIYENEKYNSGNVTKGAFIYDTDHLKNKVSEYEDVVLYGFDDLKEIWSQVYAVLEENNFDIEALNYIIDNEKLSLELRYHQIKARNDAVNYWKSGAGKYFLFDHVCRSGKTITALATCKAMGFRNVLLLTSFPCINEMEWQDTIHRFSMFDIWDNNFVDFSRKVGQYKNGEANFVAISLQDLKSNDYGNNLYGMQKRKFDNIRNRKWDCVIVDEIHYGYETEKSLNIMDELDFDYCLALSATPFVNYFKGTFNASNTNRWTLMDETKRAKEYPDSVYAKYPNLHFLLFAPPKEVFEEWKDYDPAEGLTFKKLLRLKGDGDFYYWRDVNNLVSFIYGKKNDRINKNTPAGHTRTNGMSKIGEGTLIFVPETKHCKPLKSLLEDNNALNDYYDEVPIIDFTYSDKNSASDLKNWLKKKTESGKPFIIIAVGQLTTGVTISNVDTVILMNDGESPQDLMQRMLRGRTAKDGKKDAFIIDLNPSRAFRMVYEYCSTIAEERDMSHIDVFKEYFDLVPVAYNNGNELVDVKEELNDIFEKAAIRYYDFFNRKDIINDELNENIIKMLNEIEVGELDKFDNKEQYENGGGTKGKTEKGSKNNGGSSTEESEEQNEEKNEEKKEKDRLQDAKEKLFMIIRSICWASIFCGCKFDTYTEIFKSLEQEKESWSMYNKFVYDSEEEESVLSSKDIIYMLNKCVDGKILNTIIVGFNNRFKEDPLKMDMIKLPLAEKFKKVFGEVFTPVELVEEMLDKLPKKVWSEKNYKWCDPACGSGNFLLVVKKKLMEGLQDIIKDDKKREQHILENMIYGVDIQERNSILCQLRLDPKNEYDLNIESHDSLEFDFWGLKFNIVIGNPPYQQFKNKTNPTAGMCGTTLWDKFMQMSIEKLCIQNGYVVLVHPGQWRKPEHELLDLIKQYNLIHLSIHNIVDGQKTFNASTGYDWYVLQNSNYSGTTIVNDVNNKQSTVNIMNWPFIPNCEFDKVQKLLGDTEIDVVFSHSHYETRKDWMSKNKTEIDVVFDRSNYGSDKPNISKTKNTQFKYPCVYGLTQKDGLKIYWSNTNENGHFGIPKVIIPLSKYTDAFIDDKGEYGICQFAFGIPIDSKKEGEQIKQVVISDEFKSIWDAFEWIYNGKEWRVFKYLKKDFWKEFIDMDDNNE